MARRRLLNPRWVVVFLVLLTVLALAIRSTATKFAFLADAVGPPAATETLEVWDGPGLTVYGGGFQVFSFKAPASGGLNEIKRTLMPAGWKIWTETPTQVIFGSSEDLPIELCGMVAFTQTSEPKTEGPRDPVTYRIYVRPGASEARLLWWRLLNSGYFP
jgi:hypothetical protein